MEVGLDIPDVFSIEYMFERPQPIRVELCDWTENEVTPLGSAYFLISEIVAQGVVVRNLTNEGTGVTVGQMSVGSTVKPKPPPLMLQFECKGFSRKIVPDAAVVRLKSP
ncbi:unnamed protein product [Nippostrongylus brasiliensis]|uniref:Peptidase n=1 Tax=Nippostrongylus brasiliensis TaxID=27835 RepID=A0A0N4XNA5_NIPBR|nr:unnamed protein product [Nippostrongylus brasiliensis]